MQTIADETRQGLPYFGNDLAGVDPIGNSHDSHLSLSHVPGRWLDALLNVNAAGHDRRRQVIDPSPAGPMRRRNGRDGLAGPA